MEDLIIYTDGAYSPLRDQGGIGLVFVKDGKKIAQYSNVYPHTSNNQMEIGAVIVALKSIKDKKLSKVVIKTDSQYVIGCASLGWKRRKNPKLWAQYDSIATSLLNSGTKLLFEWVKGHDGDPYNELADTLARDASQVMLD